MSMAYGGAKHFIQKCNMGVKILYISLNKYTVPAAARPVSRIHNHYERKIVHNVLYF